MSQLATRRTHRGRGVAQRLLAETFAAARERGLPQGGLSTDTRTGALDLYLRLGMEVRHTVDCWTLDLDRATDGPPPQQAPAARPDRSAAATPRPRQVDGRWIVRTVAGAAARPRPTGVPAASRSSHPGTPHRVVWPDQPGLLSARASRSADTGNQLLGASAMSRAVQHPARHRRAARRLPARAVRPGQELDRLAKALSAGARVTLVDLPNHGRSAWTDELLLPGHGRRHRRPAAGAVRGRAVRGGRALDGRQDGDDAGPAASRRWSSGCAWSTSPPPRPARSAASPTSSGACGPSTWPGCRPGQRRAFSSSPTSSDPTVRGFLLQNLRRDGRRLALADEPASCSASR